MTELTVTLPDDLARKAEAAGLLNAKGIEKALRDALRREAGRKLVEIGKLMQAANFPSMTEDEVQAEVKAVRAARSAMRPWRDTSGRHLFGHRLGLLDNDRA